MENSKKELTLNRVFNVPWEQVYKAWTDPKMVAHWWGPNGVTIPVCEIDAKPGGRIYIVMEAGEALGDFKRAQWPMEGEFVELVVPEKIVYTSNAILDGKVILETLTTVTFTEDNGKTGMRVDIVVTKTHPGSEFALAGMEQGWNEHLDKLVILMEEGLPGSNADTGSAPELITARIKELGDWRGEMLALVRQLIHEADPDILEEWKWRGVPVWEHNGIVCTGEIYKEVVKLTFARGAFLEDPHHLFNTGFTGNTRRAIDIRAQDVLDANEFRELFREAVAYNQDHLPRSRRTAGKSSARR